VRLRASPIVVAGKHTFDTSTLGKVSGIFKVDNLNPFNRSSSTTVLAFNLNIVWLDI
jgi:hypothetical protein